MQPERARLNTFGILENGYKRNVSSYLTIRGRSRSLALPLRMLSKPCSDTLSREGIDYPRIKRAHLGMIVSEHIEPVF